MGGGGATAGRGELIWCGRLVEAFRAIISTPTCALAYLRHQLANAITQGARARIFLTLSLVP